MNEAITIKVAFDTSFEDIELLRVEMENFVRHSDNSRDFQPDLNIGVSSVGNLDALDLSVAIKHKSNWHNEAVRASRRSKFICALALALRKVPLYGPGGGGAALGSSDNPSYSVTVSDEFASNARTKAAEAKDAERMVPTKPAATQAAQQDAEQVAADNFNKPPLATTVFDGFGYDEEKEMRQLQQQQQQQQQQTQHPANSSVAASDLLNTDLKKTPSQGGRRKPGEGVAPALLHGQPTLTLSPSNPVIRTRSFDEEAQTGESIVRSTSRASAMSGASLSYPHGTLAPIVPSSQMARSPSSSQNQHHQCQRPQQ